MLVIFSTMIIGEDQNSEAMVKSSAKESFRIAHVIGKICRGGVEQVVINYYRQIDKSKIQFDFIVDENSPNELPDDIVQHGAKIVKVPPYTKPILYVLSLANALKKYDIVHIHMNTMSFLALLAACIAGVRIRICHNHTTAHKSEGIRALLKYVFRPLCLSLATDYFACGEHAAVWMYGHKRLESGEVYLMRNVIDVERFRYSEEKRKRIRYELNIEQDAFVIGHIGRFVHQKNHTFLINIFLALVKMRVDTILIMIGDGPLKETIESKVFALNLVDNVRFVGSISNPEDYYSAMDVFCLPSLFEGLAVVCLEAQANSLCSLCSLYVPPDGKLPEYYRVLSLDEEPETWARKLIGCGRDNTIAEKIDASVCSMVGAVEKLESWYCDREINTSTESRINVSST